MELVPSAEKVRDHCFVVWEAWVQMREREPSEVYVFIVYRLPSDHACVLDIAVGAPEMSETWSVPSRSPRGGARRGGRLRMDESLAGECLRA